MPYRVGQRHRILLIRRCVCRLFMFLNNIIRPKLRRSFVLYLSTPPSWSRSTRHAGFAKIEGRRHVTVQTGLSVSSSLPCLAANNTVKPLHTDQPPESAAQTAVELQIGALPVSIVSRIGGARFAAGAELWNRPSAEGSVVHL